APENPRYPTASNTDTSQIRGCSVARAPTLVWLAVEASCIISNTGGRPPLPIRLWWFYQPLCRALSVSAEASCKRACLIEGHALAHHVVGGSGQFVCHRLGAHDLVGLGRFALVEALDPGVVAHGKVCGLDKGPGQVLVATFAVALALLLVVGQPLAVHAA